MVVVEYLEEALRSRHTIQVGGKIICGEMMSEERAVLGEKFGKWRIVRDVPNQTYETRMMRSENPLTRQEILGSEKRPDGTYKTKRVKKKKVAWLQDAVLSGGAEISCQEVVRVGIDCGFEIEVITQRTPPGDIKRMIGEADIAILNNIWSFYPDQMKAILNAIYTERLPYVKYEHDHRELGRPEFSKPLFQRSRLNVFLSPIHRENHVNALGCDGICLPLAIETEKFRVNGEVKREEGTALVCNVRHFKTWNNLQAYIDHYQKIQFTILAKEPVVKGPNVRSQPMIAYEAMPSFYGQFEYLVHLLDGWGAGERVVLEAALCGCKIVANERVGHTSWKRDLTNSDDLREWLTQAPYDFWKEIDKIV